MSDTEQEWSYGDDCVGASVPLSVRRGGATGPLEKVELSGNGTSYRGHAAPYECQDCGNVQRFVTSQFRFMSDCHECGSGRFFEFDFTLARSHRPDTDRTERGER